MGIISFHIEINALQCITLVPLHSLNTVKIHKNMLTHGKTPQELDKLSQQSLFGHGIIILTFCYNL